jgi:hypothetical protein
MPRWNQTVGVLAVLAVGIVSLAAAWRLPSLLHNVAGEWGTTASRSTAWRTIKSIPPRTWVSFCWMFLVVGIALVLFATIALWFVRQNRPRIALVAIAAAMVPIGFSMIEGVARMAPYFSLAEAAQFIDARVAPNDKVIYEGPMHVGSSLLFYLGRRFYLVNQDPFAEPGARVGPAPDIFLKEPTVLQAWAGSDRIFLLLESNRLPHWRRLLEDAGLPLDELTICGTTVLLSNHR